MLTGAALQALRRVRGFESARELADATGISRSVWANIESDRRPLGLDEVLALTRALGVSVFVLVPELRDHDPELTRVRAEVRAEMLDRVGSLLAGA